MNSSVPRFGQLLDNAKSEVGSGPVVGQRWQKRHPHAGGSSLLADLRVALAQVLPDEKDVEIGQLRWQVREAPGADRDLKAA
jgi:hypothetical protein